MATEAIVVANTQLVKIKPKTTMVPIVQLAPMPPGRSYVVWASGDLLIRNCLVNVELEAFGAKDMIQLAGANDTFSYALTVGTTLPADDDLFTVAKVSAEIVHVFPAGENKHERAEVSTVTGRLVALAVDSLTVLAV